MPSEGVTGVNRKQTHATNSKDVANAIAEAAIFSSRQLEERSSESSKDVGESASISRTHCKFSADAVEGALKRMKGSELF